MIGNAAARHGSTTISAPLWNLRMCSWHVAVPRCGPWAWPSIISEHVPQMPSRQSWSNDDRFLALGDQPLVEHVEHLEERRLVADLVDRGSVSNRPASSGPSCRQIFSVMLVRLVVASLVAPGRARWTVSYIERLRRGGWRPSGRRSTPTRRRGRSARRRAGPRPPRSGTRRGSGHRSSRWRSSASRHISMPSSKKSSTRPAFSSVWLTLVPSPVTRRSFWNSSYSAGISDSAFSQALLGALHAAVVPDDLAQLAVEVVGRAGAVDREVAVEPSPRLRSRRP